MNAIEIKSLNKSYGANHVIKGISLDVKKSEIFALLGVNGAGKTTTLECIEGLRKYDSGNIVINGKCGVQLQSSSLQECIKGKEAIKLFSKWNKTVADKETLSALGIDDIADKQYKEMSTGQKRRLHLAIAVLGDPDIIILDEPTAGLDVEGRIALHEEIRRLNSQGKTIILASHDMAEVEALCNRVAILKDGEVAFLGTVDELRSRFSTSSAVTVKTSIGEDTFTVSNIGEALLLKLEDYKKQQISVLDIKIERSSLEDSFIEIARGTAE